MAATQPFSINRRAFVGPDSGAEREVSFRLRGQSQKVVFTGPSAQLRPGEYWVEFAGRGQWVKVPATVRVGESLQTLMDSSIGII